MITLKSDSYGRLVANHISYFDHSEIEAVHSILNVKCEGWLDMFVNNVWAAQVSRGVVGLEGRRIGGQDWPKKRAAREKVNRWRVWREMKERWSAGSDVKIGASLGEPFTATTHESYSLLLRVHGDAILLSHHQVTFRLSFVIVVLWEIKWWPIRRILMVVTLLLPQMSLWRTSTRSTIISRTSRKKSVIKPSRRLQRLKPTSQSMQVRYVSLCSVSCHQRDPIWCPLLLIIPFRRWKSLLFFD